MGVEISEGGHGSDLGHTHVGIFQNKYFSQRFDL